MSYDAFVAGAVARELSGLLPGRTLLEVRLSPGPALVLVFGPRRNPAWVVLAVGTVPAAYGLEGEPPEPIVKTSGDPTPPPGLDPFYRLLEARLVGRTFGRMELCPWERTLTLAFLPREGLRGDRRPAFLVHEAAPRPARFVLLDPDRRVLSSWPVNAAHQRPGAGEPYQPPARKETAAPSDLAEHPSLFREALSGCPDLLAVAPALGPSVAAEIARRACLSGGERLRALHSAFVQIVSCYPEGPFHPILLVRADPPHRPVDVSVVELAPGPGLAALPAGGVGEAVRAWHEAAVIEASYRTLTVTLRRAVRSALARARRKITKQTADLTTAGRPDELKQAGELLLAHLHTVQPGDTSATVTDYDGSPVTISLEPRLSPSRNAQRYFERYRRARRALDHDVFRTTAERELAWLETIAYDLSEIETRPPDEGDRPKDAIRWTEVHPALDSLKQRLDELQNIERAMKAAGYKITGGTGRVSTGHRFPPKSVTPQSAAKRDRLLHYLTTDGLSVLAGRSARQNEALSLKKARPNDIWLHARGVPGSHVILRLRPEGGSEIPENSLLQAAALAAHLSAARGAGKVAVDHTRARYLRRPKGVPPGLILYEPHETILVDTDKISLPQPVGMEEKVGKG